jgi:hypothetical protein
MIPFWGCKRAAQEAQQQGGPHPQATQGTPAPTPDSSHLETISDVVLHILYTAREGGGVILQGTCSAHGIQDASVAASPDRTQTMEQALGDISAQRQNIYWRQSQAAGVRVVDSKAQAGLLKVRVKEFRVVEDLEPDAVMSVLWRQPEVRSFLRSHKITFVRRAYGARKVLSPPIILEVKNSTVAGILDRIAAAYRHDPPKVWVYQECRDKAATMVDVRIP